MRHLPRFFDYTTEVSYSRIERVRSVDEIAHPSVREAMRMLDMREVRLSYEADLPARTGLGTSSSFAVGMLSAFHALKGEQASKRELAEEAIELERVRCAEAGGWQDQVAAAYGGLNRIEFSASGFEVYPIVIPPARRRKLESSLMLFFTGFSRRSAEVQASVPWAEREAELLDALVLVDEAQEVLTSPDAPLSRFGELLDAGWRLKRGLGERVSTDGIDDAYARALSAGASGGKLLGAGGGGFLLFFVEPDARESVRAALSDLMEVPFSFEGGGTRIVHYAPEPWDGESVGENGGRRS